MAPPKKALKPKPKGSWQPGDRVTHTKHGAGTVSKIIRNGDKVWLEIKFGYDYLQISPSDPSIERG